ncbi:hypothetical protein QOZ80_3BG0261210 [Eleusine coracana subsp. coracana]|nr:hypothetical protein QOZ80_3BG0261210 [Eleusine coracana subsp. coracana]
MKKGGAASRYASYDSASPSPSPRRTGPPSAAATPTHGSSRALVAARSGRDLLGAKPQPQAQHGNLGSVLRRLISMDKKPPAKNHHHLPVPPAAAAAAAAKNNGGGKLPGLSRKLFQKGSSDGGKKKPAALTDAKNGGNNANTRTLAMVLRSERELLAQNKAQEDEIATLRFQLENKDREVERLKNLCLRQKEEISTLKDAVLFPDAQPGPEPDRRLRDEISTLTGQIQNLAQELAQVKAEKHTSRSGFDDDDGDGYCSSPRTPRFNEETAFSLECSIGEAETPNCGSPDEMFSKDLNPCLTPCIAKSKSDVSSQFHSSSHSTQDYQETIGSHRSTSKQRVNNSYGSLGRPMSKSSDNHKPTSGSNSKRRVNKSDHDRIYQNLF